MENPKKMLVDIESSMLWRVMKIENLICLVCVLQSCATWVWERDQTRTIVTRMDIGGYRLHTPFQSTEGRVFQWRIAVKNRMKWCTHLVWRISNQIWVKASNQKTTWTADAWFNQHLWFYFEENRCLLCSRHWVLGVTKRIFMDPRKWKEFFLSQIKTELSVGRNHRSYF
jgi:hypothetical protein